MSDWFLLTLAGEGGSFLSPLLLLPQKLYTFLGDLSSIDPNDNTADKNRGRSGRSNLLWDNAGQGRGRATFRAALPLATLKNAFYFPRHQFHDTQSFRRNAFYCQREVFGAGQI